MLYRIQIIASAVFVGIGPGDKCEDTVILNRSVNDLDAVFLPSPTKTIRAVSGSRDANNQLIGVSLHRLFEAVVLRRLLQGVDFVNNRKVAVERVLRIRVARQCLDTNRPGIAKIPVEAVAHGAVQDAEVLLLAHPDHVPLKEIERLHGLFALRRHNIT